MHSRQRNTYFQFQQFTIRQERCAMKVSTDSVMLAAWTSVDGVGAILDIGSGSGVISLILAQRAPDARITGVEIDQPSADQSRDNIAQSPWPDRIDIVHLSIQDFAATSHQTFDLIVSNPPFFTGGTLSLSEEKSGVRHTLRLPHSDLLKAARRLLRPGGTCCLVLPLIEGLRFIELAHQAGFYVGRITEVRPRADKPVERLLLCFHKTEKALQRSELVIQSEDAASYTPEFGELVRGLYLYN